MVPSRGLVSLALRPHRWILVALVMSAGLVPALRAQDVENLVYQFTGSVGKGAQETEAAQAVLRNYGAYKQLVAEGKVSPTVARRLDEHLVTMTQQVWRDVAVRHGSGLSYVVPVGTLGSRLTNPKYIPGKSDKDFIPYGDKAAEAARDFAVAFEREFGFSAASVDVNALDPTTINGWPSRVLAAGNYEKYNTAGGTKWLDAQLYKQQPNLWRYDTVGDAVSEVTFAEMVTEAPPALTAADAAGFLSDNMKFRQHLADEFSGDLRTMVWRQSKYDLRNMEAFALAGGALDPADEALKKAAELMRENKMDNAVYHYMQATGAGNYDEALAAYAKAMESLNERMTRQIMEQHVALMLDGKTSIALTNELAAAMANLPPSYARAVEETVVSKLGRAEWNEVSKLATAFKQELARQATISRFSIEYFNSQAVYYFGKPYDKLDEAERAVLHGVQEASEQSLKGMLVNLGLSGWSCYDAYAEGRKQGLGVGLASAAARAMIEAVQAGYSPAAAAELVGRAAAGVIDLGISAYKNDALETLYRRFQEDPALTVDELLSELGSNRYVAGGLRQVAIEMRQKGKDGKPTDAEIDAAIRAYFTRRREVDKANEETDKLFKWAEKWIHDASIPLEAGRSFLVALSENEALRRNDEKTYYALLAGVVQNYQSITAMLRHDRVQFSQAEIEELLFHRYRGTPESFRKVLEKLYHRAGRDALLKRRTHSPTTTAAPTTTPAPSTTSAPTTAPAPAKKPARTTASSAPTSRPAVPPAPTTAPQPRKPQTKPHWKSVRTHFTKIDVEPENMGLVKSDAQGADGSLSVEVTNYEAAGKPKATSRVRTEATWTLGDVAELTPGQKLSISVKIIHSGSGQWLGGAVNAYWATPGEPDWAGGQLIVAGEFMTLEGKLTVTDKFSGDFEVPSGTTPGEKMELRFTLSNSQYPASVRYEYEWVDGSDQGAH